MTRLELAVVQVAESVRRRFARKRAPVDLDDIAQDAAEAALVAVRSGRLDMRQNVRGYLYRAARADAGLAASRALSVVTLSEHEAATNARRYQARVVRVETGDGDVEEVVNLLPSPWPSPLEVLERRREEGARTADRERRDAILDAWMDGLGRGDVRALQMLLGFGGQDAAAGGVDEVAFRLGVPRADVLRAVGRLRALVRRDRDPAEMKRVMLEAT